MGPAPLIPRHLTSREGPVFRVMGNLVTVKAMTADTGGAYLLCEVGTAPGQGTPLHLERYEDKAFFVLQGTYALRLGDQILELRPGAFAFAPRGTMHGYTNTGSAPARMLVLVSPGGVHEQFLAEVGEPFAAATEEAPAGGLAGKALTAAEKYGIEVLSLPGV